MRALISVYDKAGVADFSRGLAELDFELVASGGTAAHLEEHGVELAVLAGYMHLLTPPFLRRFPQRVINIHPSLLPAFPGAHAIDDALAAGVETTGVTVHYVDEGLDTGLVIAQEEVSVEPRETLEERLHAVEHRLLPKVVSELSLAAR